MAPPALLLLTSHDRHEARRLIESQGLRFEDDCDELVGIYEGGRLVAVAGRAGYVLKMFAIDPAVQGGDSLGQLAGALVESGRRAGHDALLVYTRPQHANSFAACNFRLLVTTGEVALLEYGGGLEAYLDECRRRRRGPEGAQVAAVVINGNPFTRGHLFLVETAAARVDTLYLFVVREDRSVFPFDVRYQLAAAAVRHLANVVLLDTSRYAISAATFPSYFLRRDDEAARLQMEVDARLFGEHVAPALAIGWRFVGHEPYCPTTAAYNETLAKVLPACGVRLEVVPRTGDASGFISASRVRAALGSGDLAAVRPLVPDATFAWLTSAEGRALVERLRQ